MNHPSITQHAKQQLKARFDGMITFEDVCAAVNARKYRIGQTCVEIKRLPQVIALPDNTNGDVIYAVVDKRYAKDNGRVVTVMVRRSTSADRSFRLYSQISENHRVWTC